MSQEDIPSHCITNLIRDIPSDTDSFAIHSRIAEAIIDLVERERGGISVGISGSWGSGKSTIINFIQKKFKEDHGSTSQCHLWLFDTWEHEGDHLRRMFLESMNKSLKDAKWLISEEWQNDLDYLAKRRKRSIQHDKPRISMFLVALAVATLAIPIGSALLTNALYQRVIHYTFDWATWEIRFVIPIMLILAPVLPLFCILIYYVIRRYVCKNEQRSFKEFAASYFTWFLQRSATEIERVIVQDPDPTSIEFASTFRDMMKAALEPPERRFVIVIDNLDRINTDNAKVIWSTLQTFLQVKADEEEDWHERFFVVIPYDHNGISRIWGGESGEKQELVESFLNKSFQIRFHVPITSDVDWKDYLLGDEVTDRRTGILHEALPQHSADDFHRVYRLYDVMRVRGSLRGAPTPRELILYVNQIGALHRVWGDTISISDLAYFTLLQRRGENIHQGLLSGAIPEDNVMPYLALNAQDDLAALHFGVSIEHAQVLLLRGPILEALYKVDHKRLAELAKIHPRPFRTVLQRAITDIEAEQRITTVNEIARAAATLSMLDHSVLGADIDTYINHQLAVLCNRMHRVLKQLKGKTFAWTPPIEIEIDGFTRLATHDSKLISFFVSLFGHLPLWESDGRPILEGITGYVQSLKMLYDKLKKASLLSDDYAAIVPGGPQVYRTVATHLHIEGTDRMYWHLFKPDRSLLNSGLQLVDNVKETRYTNDHRMMLQVLKIAEPSFDLLPVFQEMVKVLEGQLIGMSIVSSVTAMLESLFDFMHEQAVADLVDQIAEHDLYSYLFTLSADTNSIELSAIVTAIFMRSVPERLNYNHEWTSILYSLLEDPADDLAERIVALLGQSDAYERTLNAVPSTRNFVSACLKLLEHPRDE